MVYLAAWWTGKPGFLLALALRPWVCDRANYHTYLNEELRAVLGLPLDLPHGDD